MAQRKIPFAPVEVIVFSKEIQQGVLENPVEIGAEFASAGDIAVQSLHDTSQKKAFDVLGIHLGHMGAAEGRIRQEDIVPFIAFEEVSPVTAVMEGADEMKVFVRQFLQFQIAGLFPLFDQGQALMQKFFDLRRGMKNPGSFIGNHFI
jgi:hypothetical protein